MCEYCASFAREMGYAVKVEKINGSGNVMSATLNPNAEGEPVCMSAHMDTVHPKGLFGVRREGDTLIGPGVYDCKGGIAIALLTMKALLDNGFEKHVRLILTSDEEISNILGGPDEIRFIQESAKGFPFFIFIPPNCAFFLF